MFTGLRKLKDLPWHVEVAIETNSLSATLSWSRLKAEWNVFYTFYTVCCFNTPPVKTKYWQPILTFVLQGMGRLFLYWTAILWVPRLSVSGCSGVFFFSNDRFLYYLNFGRSTKYPTSMDWVTSGITHWTCVTPQVPLSPPPSKPFWGFHSFESINMPLTRFL